MFLLVQVIPTFSMRITIVNSLGAGAAFLEKLKGSLGLANTVVGDMGKCTVPRNNSLYTVNTDIHSLINMFL